MARYVLVLCLVLCALLALVASSPSRKNIFKRAAKRAAKTPAKKVIKCRECKDVEKDDCQGGKMVMCDTKCYKITGIADDTKDVPDWAWPMIGVDIKAHLQKNKGKKVVYRGCAPKDMIDYATAGGEYEDEGCSDVGDEFPGIKNCNACLCGKDSFPC